MDREEFLERLAALPSKGWRAFCTNNAIRLNPPGRPLECCPITAVEFDLRGPRGPDQQPVSIYGWERAADNLGLSRYRDARPVVNAADRSLDAQQTVELKELRLAMVKGLGLTPEDCDHVIS
jgi:hypothetical protein